MILSEEEIQFIDNYLKEAGIGYWDIRLEMTDHIASKLEDMNGSCDFEFAFKNTLEELNWTGNLKWLERQRLIAINRVTRTAYFKNVASLFINLKTISLIVLSIWVYFLLYSYLSFSVFKWISASLFLGPVVYFTLHSIVTYFRMKKVGYLTYGYFYIAFSILVTNGFYQIFRPEGIVDVSVLTRHKIFFMTTVVNVLFIISGIKIYMKYYHQYKNLFAKLNTNNF